MRPLSVGKIAALQKEPANIRNICILAHVDHGKTTLADALVASNGVISQRMAGKLRYLDSREDEQIRGITMKSSAISLIFTKEDTDTLINLIDSPGHIDFSSEVSTAVRLCDGAIVLVDVVEGVCPQTHAVLRQAWLENIRPVLVLNKMDRLITELKMSPIEAHLHLQQILEQVNAITAELFTSEVMGKTSDPVESENKEEGQQAKLGDKVFDWSSGVEETDDAHLYFSPGESNVVFTSAIDGWGFGISEFAELYAQKLGLNAKVLLKTLWGDFYLDSKTKRIKRGAAAKGKKSLFVQFILDNLWAVYETVLENRDKEKVEKIVNSLKLKIPPRDARHSDPKVHLQAICSRWMPLAKAVLAMVVSKLPSPLELEETRAEKLLCSRVRRFDTLPQQTQALKTAFLACSGAENAPVIVYVSKLFTIERKHLPSHKQRPLTQEEMTQRRELARQRHADKLTASESANTGVVQSNGQSDSNGISELIVPSADTKDNQEDQILIAFARIFSGTVKKGQKLYVLGPKYDPAKALAHNVEAQKYMSEFVADELYLFMGRELEDLEEISAGNIIGLGGLEDHILKSATISSTLSCPPFTEMYFEASPIVRVAVEPVNAGDLGALNKGLKLLNQADPCVEIQILENGEQVIIAAGEVHLQKCLDDLQKSFAKVQVNTSKPIVPFRESIIPLPKFDRRNEAIMDQNPSVRRKEEKGGEEEGEGESDEEVTEEGVVDIQTANRLCGLKIRAVSLPTEVIKLLEEYSDLLKELDSYFNYKISNKLDKNAHSLNTQTRTELLKLKDLLIQAFESATNEDNQWESVVEQIWCFGPRRSGPNILVNRITGYNRPSLWSCLQERSDSSNGKGTLRESDYCIVSGFQMATLSGPLCEESMYGVCFILEAWENYDKALSVKERKALLRDMESVKRVDSSGSLKGVKDEATRGSCPEKCLDTNTSDTTIGKTVQKSAATTTASLDIRGSHDNKQRDQLINQKISGVGEEALRSTVDTLDSLAESPCSPVSPGSPGWSLPAPREVYGPFSGQLMSCMKEGCRRAFQAQPQRLMWAMYTCVVQATTEVLGKMYAVLSKRHGRVLGEDMKEGTSIFHIDAVLPVVESFGFAEEFRKRTSGLASPQLRFSHWEVIDLDPFWVPTTEEEYLHFGEKADSENVARKYMNSIRRRKGLPTSDKLVEFGEKQRTLTRNK